MQVCTSVLLYYRATVLCLYMQWLTMRWSMFPSAASNQGPEMQASTSCTPVPLYYILKGVAHHEVVDVPQRQRRSMPPRCGRAAAVPAVGTPQPALGVRPNHIKVPGDTPTHRDTVTH